MDLLSHSPNLVIYCYGVFEIKGPYCITVFLSTTDMINTIESGIDIEVLGGIDIGIEIDKSISGILILVLKLLRSV